MLSAATRLAALGVLLLIRGLDSCAAQGAPSLVNPAPPVLARASPARPIVASKLPTGVRVGGVEYVTATALALWLGCKGTWTEPLRKLVLTDKTNPANQVELAAESREAGVNGMR